MFFLSSVSVILIFSHYGKAVKLKKLLNLLHEKDTLRSSGFLNHMIMEILLSLMICPPYIDVTFKTGQVDGDIEMPLNGVFFTISLIRVYYVLRLYEQYSRWTNENAIKVCRENDCLPSIWFLLKCELSKRPYTMVCILILSTAGVLGVAVRAYEM